MDQLTLACTLYLSILVPALSWLIIRRLCKLERLIDRLPTREELDARFAGVYARQERIITDVGELRPRRD
jgi:hypothetical protein